MPFAESINTRVIDANNKFYAMVGACIGLLIAKDEPGARGILPEPFDFFNHVGNIDGSAQVGYVAGILLGKLAANRANEKGEPLSKGSLRARMAAGGLVVGLVVNGLIESKWGMNLIHWQNTSDPLDFAYGVATSTAVAGLLPTVEEQPQNRYVADAVEPLSQDRAPCQHDC